MVRIENAFAGRRVLVTGHTGFKGSWLTIWLRKLQAEVSGYALTPLEPSMYSRLQLASICDSTIADIRDLSTLTTVVRDARPDFIFHLAAQPLVLTSYEDPLGTISTNILGTAHLLEAVRLAGRDCTVVIVTSDKCYENMETSHAYREDDRLGGHDVYSMSKAATELVTASYRRSFFDGSVIRVASARAGNVIGGGDWAANRIVPDSIRALRAHSPIVVRNPQSVRPWQHVLESLSGYLALAAALAEDLSFAHAWNFGPEDDDVATVAQIVAKVVEIWGDGEWTTSSGKQPHEAAMLRLSIDKAKELLAWRPRWRVSEAVKRTVEWYRAETAGADVEALRALCHSQIDAYLSS
jgi:CDP-glucose 4,6-dehydratase